MTKSLLGYLVLAGPLYVMVSLVQALTRTGFSLRRDEWSLNVQLELDETPRRVAVPDDLAAVLAGDPDARAFFDGLSYSRRHAYVSWIEQAKRSETRQERVRRTAELLAQRQPQR